MGTRHKTRRGYRIGVVLALLSVVPLVGAASFAVLEVVEARAELDRVQEVDESVQDLVALSELRTRLLDEQNWTAAESGIEQLGLTPGIVVALTGINVPEQAAVAATSVDDVVDDLALDDVAMTLRDIRADTDSSLAETGLRYQELERSVALMSQERLDRVLWVAGEVSDSGPLIQSLQILEAATVARQSISAEFNHFFGAQFSDFADRTDELTALIGRSMLRDEAMAKMTRLVSVESATRDTLDLIDASESAQAFDMAALSLVEENLLGSAREAALTSVLSDLDEVARTFEDSSVATGLYLDLVNAAGDDVYAASAAASERAQRRDQRALIALATLAIASIAAALAATRAIARPIHLLALAARRIRDGDARTSLVVESGPSEVREAARAINEAGSHLALAERQALALAEGDLDHDSLRETSSGALGASLQSAVQTLAASLHEREEFRRRMTHEATHDGLTGLPNRNASLHHLQSAVARVTRSHGDLAVLFVDLDGFKEVNDTLGHHAGDAVLRCSAQRLVAASRDGDHVGRLGGDEFVVIAEPVADGDEALAIARSIHAALSMPITVDSTALTVGASIGVALSSQSSGTAGDLLRDADLAVYKAKDLGRSRIELCDDDLRAAMAKRADLEQALRRALMDDEFVLYYQPIVEPKTGGTVGYEALIRWNRPDHGLVAPDDFIPFAERSDLIVHIDRWVLRNVAHQIVAWDGHGVMGDIPVSINISGRHLASKKFVSNIIGPLDEYGIDPSRIIIEITESALLDDLTSAAVKLQHLRNRGIRTAIDDFGTGYTSLAHLKSLPVDILKIDRSFTADDSAASLVQLIIDTGHLLGATVTAEGIETPDQARLLGAMGSDDLQGYLYGRPVPAGELSDLTPQSTRRTSS